MERPTYSPSLFWGCVEHTASDRFLHDPAKLCSDSVWIAFNKYRITITIKDSQALFDKCSSLHTDWIQREASTTDLDCTLRFMVDHKNATIQLNKTSVHHVRGCTKDDRPTHSWGQLLWLICNLVMELRDGLCSSILSIKTCEIITMVGNNGSQ